jgi:hypothetical protein
MDAGQTPMSCESFVFPFTVVQSALTASVDARRSPLLRPRTVGVAPRVHPRSSTVVVWCAARTRADDGHVWSVCARPAAAMGNALSQLTDDFPNPDSLCDFVTRPRQSVD